MRQRLAGRSELSWLSEAAFGSVVYSSVPFCCEAAEDQPVLQLIPGMSGG